MKKLLSVTVFIVICSLLIEAQTSQGNFLVGISSSLSVAGTGPDLMSIGYSTTRDKSDASGFQESDADKTFNLNLLPKIGYFVSDNFALGLDLSLAISNSDYNSSMVNPKSTSTMINVGPFIRYYFPTGTVAPFFELGTSFGHVKSTYSYSYDYGSYNEENKGGIFLLNGGLGIAAPLGDKASLDLMAGYNRMRAKDTKDNPDNDRTIYNNFGIELGFVVFLGMTD